LKTLKQSLNIMAKISLKLILPLFLFFGASAQQWGDYTLYSVMGSTTTQLMDTNGTVVKTWTHSSTAKSGYSCYLMPGGYLWRSVAKTGNSFTGGPINGQVQKVAWDGTLLWDYVYSTTDYCTHHDICPLPNGNVLLIAYDRISAANVSAAGCKYSGEVWSEKVVEIKPTGATTGDVVWEWKVWDHIVQNADASKPNYQSSLVNHPELLNVNYKTSKDWIHMNGVDYNPILDQISVSSHNLNEWYLIDHSTTKAEAASHKGGNSGKGGDFLYRWGNPAAYEASGTAVLNVTHDAHWIPEGVPNAGRLVGFNNKGVSSSKSSVDQIVTPVNGYNYDITLGSAFAPSTYDRHACNGYTSNAGCSEQLPNGNMMVCIALSGTVYEIDPKGTSIWTKTVAGSIQQAHRYSKCFTDNEPPALPEITLSNSQLVSTKATTYQWYLNGQILNGVNTQTISPPKDGIYVVRITDNLGCVYRYSSGFKYASGAFSVFANPTQNQICKNDSVTIKAEISGENGITTYNWFSNPAGFLSTAKTVKVAPSNSTTYTVIAINNLVNDTSSVLITVNSLPNKPVIIQTGSALTSSGGVSYLWYLDLVQIKNASGPQYNPSQSGAYRVKAIDANGCLSDFSDPFSYFTSGISQLSPINTFVVSPNPGSGTFKITNSGTFEISEIAVSNFLGQEVFKTTSSEIIDLSTFKNGVYYFLIRSVNGFSQTIKINLIK
jgi:hypothetical protein